MINHVLQEPSRCSRASLPRSVQGILSSRIACAWLCVLMSRNRIVYSSMYIVMPSAKMCLVSSEVQIASYSHLARDFEEFWGQTCRLECLACWPRMLPPFLFVVECLIDGYRLPASAKCGRWGPPTRWVFASDASDGICLQCVRLSMCRIHVKLYWWGYALLSTQSSALIVCLGTLDNPYNISIHLFDLLVLLYFLHSGDHPLICVV